MECQSHESGVSEIIKEKEEGRDESRRGDEWRERKGRGQ